MTQKRSYKRYPKEFKEEAVKLILEQGYTVSEAAKSVGVTTTLLYKWKAKIEEERKGAVLDSDERDELKRMRKEIKELRMEKEMQKNLQPSFPKK